MGNNLVAQPSFAFSIAYTKVNPYLGMKYFLNTDDKFMVFRGGNGEGVD